jgi:hypothetical protein
VPSFLTFICSEKGVRLSFGVPVTRRCKAVSTGEADA